MQAIVDFFNHYAQIVPLDLFVLVGTFIEELCSPIPSFVVLVPAGAAAHSQGFQVWYLAILVVCSAIGRIVGATILYRFADAIEDRLLAKGRRFFGISHTQIERFGQRLGHGNRRDWVLLFAMNALPLFPAGVLSLSCGFFKVRYRMFLVCTFFGTMINALIYLIIGYYGLRLVDAMQRAGLVTQIALGIGLLVGAILWLRRKRR